MAITSTASCARPTYVDVVATNHPLGANVRDGDFTIAGVVRLIGDYNIQVGAADSVPREAAIIETVDIRNLVGFAPGRRPLRGRVPADSLSRVGPRRLSRQSAVELRAGVPDRGRALHHRPRVQPHRAAVRHLGRVAGVTYPFTARYLAEARPIVSDEFVTAGRGSALDLKKLEAALDDSSQSLLDHPVGQS